VLPKLAARCGRGSDSYSRVLPTCPSTSVSHPCSDGVNASFAVIPPFHSAVDRAISYLDPVQGLLGVTDFFVSAKYDLPLRQMIWARRFFWRCVFL